MKPARPGDWRVVWVSDDAGKAAASFEDELRKREIAPFIPRPTTIGSAVPDGAVFFDEGDGACLRMGFLTGLVHKDRPARLPVVYVPNGEGSFLFDVWRQVFKVKPEVLGSLAGPMLARRISNKLRRARP